MMNEIKHDSFGEKQIEKGHIWGAHTQRTFENFKIGTEKMPIEIIKAIVEIKRAAAMANFDAKKLNKEQCDLIVNACEKVLSGEYDGEFLLPVWQTGSGTMTNMNVNEVLSSLTNGVCHPNDHCNLSQSTNDVFPSALHLAAALEIKNGVLPALDGLYNEFLRLAKENKDVIKVGRTHLQDATPVRFSDELFAYATAIDEAYEEINFALNKVLRLPIGGTAVGNGINCPDGFDVSVCKTLSERTGLEFVPIKDKFFGLSQKSALCFLHSALKNTAAAINKIANDIRFMACGPRCGIGEINIPQNEAGSSIMPGKVNPTQVEAFTQIFARILGNDTTVSFACANGQMELNVYMPVIGYAVIQSARLLCDGVNSLNIHCVKGITANREKMKEYLDNSLMTVTALSPALGYEKAAQIAKYAEKNGLSILESAQKFCDLSEDELKEILNPEKMI
ncbi:MAG: class II fumarate hydratase [Oscillospiraceae bacterium]|nr:class II fumarate hydratase [Candidatus Equicaccousia limihippi]